MLRWIMMNREDSLQQRKGLTLWERITGSWIHLTRIFLFIQLFSWFCSPQFDGQKGTKSLDHQCITKNWSLFKMYKKSNCGITTFLDIRKNLGKQLFKSCPPHVNKSLEDFTIESWQNLKQTNIKWCRGLAKNNYL